MDNDTAAPVSHTSRTIVHLAHIGHADRRRRLTRCPLCSLVGPSKVTWDEAKRLLQTDGAPA